MSEAAALLSAARPRLESLPVGLFGTVTGLSCDLSAKGPRAAPYRLTRRVCGRRRRETYATAANF
jgi:hypothetical protein